MKAEGLEVGDKFFDSQGRPYTIKKGTFGIGKQAVAGERPGMVQAEMNDGTREFGGPVVAGQTYTTNDKLNSLGYQQEGFMPFTPQVSGTIYSNIATMPRYDIPSGAKLSGVNISNSPSSNNVYDINIALNGTNVTARDVIIEMKREMALVNAKEGIDRKVGGGY